jgi:hypothetical protein
MIEYLGYLATTQVLLAVYYISKPKLRGQYFIISADCSWLLYACITQQWALGIQSIILLGIGFAAVRNWKREKIPF